MHDYLACSLRTMLEFPLFRLIVIKHAKNVSGSWRRKGKGNGWGEGAAGARVVRSASEAALQREC